MTRVFALCLLLSFALPVIARAQATATDAGEAKGLSWFEITAYSPKYHPPDDAWLARLAKTGKWKLKILRKNAQFEVHTGAKKYRDAWQKVADACKAAIGG